MWDSGWDEELGTVPPEKVTEAGIRMHNKYPNKRLLIHYMQPHYPFIGPTGLKLPHTNRVESLVGRVKGRNVEKTDDIWDLLRQGAVSESEVITAYQENLEVVIPQIKTLLKKINGKSVITSDHGNLYGERLFPFFSKLYGHPTGIHAKNLIEVPWLVISSERRRKITEGEKKQIHEVEYSGEVMQRLKNLGYN